MADETPSRLRAARHFAGLSRLQVAEALEVHESTYKGRELGKYPTPRPELLAIADLTGVPMWFLEGGWENYPRPDSIEDLGDGPTGGGGGGRSGPSAGDLARRLGGEQDEAESA